MTSAAKCYLPLSAGWQDLESPPDQIRIVELTSPDQRGGMAAPFPHGAGTFNAQRPGDQPLTAIRAGHDASRPKSAACTLGGRNCSQFTIIRHRVVRTMAASVRVDVDEIMTPSRSEEHTSELQSLRHLVC